MTQKPIPVIGTAPAFYGYIVGLSVGLWDWEFEGQQEDRNLYVMFEYGGNHSVWLVPDSDLFRILSRFLCEQAWHRSNTDAYGNAKLWIERKEDGKWLVDLP
jgi:hypothetical protein